LITGLQHEGVWPIQDAAYEIKDALSSIAQEAQSRSVPSKSAPKTDEPENHRAVDVGRSPFLVRRRVMSRASARSKSEPLASSTPRASSCRTKASNWSEANASRKVTYLRSISSPNERIEAQLAAETPRGLFRGTLYRELGEDGASLGDEARRSGALDLRSLPHCQYDGGGIAKGATGTVFVDGNQVAQGQIPQTAAVRFSFDETFDVGEDTGTPVVEDYVDKMPLPFTGTLKKFVVVLEPEKLTEEERKRLLEEEAKASMARQ
jgi:hypothetical protein